MCVVYYLAVFFCFFCFSMSQGEDEDVDMTFASHDLLLHRPLQVGMDIRVVLVGMQDMVDADALANLLRASMSTKQVHAIDSGVNLLVQYVISFDVLHREKLIWGDGNLLPTASDIEECVFKGILEALKKPGDTQQDKMIRSREGLVVNVTSSGLDKVLGSFVHQINTEQATGLEREKKFHHTVFILHPNLDRMAKYVAEGPDRKLLADALSSKNRRLTYSYSNNDSPVHSPVFAGRAGRFVVIDTNALPSVFGPLEAPEGAVAYRMFPFAPRDSKDALLGKLSNAILSASTHVFFPDVKSDVVSTSKLVLVPVFVFRNHKLSFHPHMLFQGASYDLDVKILIENIKPLKLPHMDMKLIFSRPRSLYDDAHVGLALTKAMQTVMDHKLHFSLHDFLQSKRLDTDAAARSFLNGKALLSNLMHHADDLTHELLTESAKLGDADASSLLSSFFGMKRSTHLRLFPVFVFSLASESPVFFDNHDLHFAESQGAVVVMSNWSNAVSPFFQENADNKRSLVRMDCTQATGSVLDALVEGIGNVSPPHLEFNMLHNKTSFNYFWSPGATFGGAFASGTGMQPFSDNLRENVARSNMIVMLHYSVKAAQRVMQAVFDFEEEFHQHKHIHDLQEDLNSGEAGRMATAQVKLSLKQMQEYMWRVSELFNRQKSDELTSLFTLAVELPRMADNMEKSANRILEEARYEISCCTHKVVRRESQGSFGGLRWLLALFIVLASIAVVYGAYRVLAPLLLKGSSSKPGSKLF